MGTADAKLTVTDESGKTYEPENGAFYLPAGKTYTYTAAKYGYKAVSGSFEIAAGEEKSISVPALAALATREITFNVTPAGAALTLTHELGGALTANEGTTATYTLYEGETYTYTVSKSDYLTKTGSFTVSDDETITIALTYAGEGWDGTTKTQPGYQNGAYQIADAAQLAWFAEQVNSGSAGINAVLTQNINLSGKPWTPIGTSTNSYAGTFDGQNHLVSGLTGASGLFDSIAAAGTVKNLNVSAVLNNTTTYGQTFLGILANISEGTVENCFTSGSVSKKNASGAMGGLVGKVNAGGVVSGSGSSANVSCSMKSLYAELNMGGLVGNLYGTAKNSYATGDITVVAGNDYKAVGGFVGQTSGTAAVIQNCYAAGTITGSTGGVFGAFVGTNNGTITGGYYREGAAPVAVATGSASGTRALTESYMKSKDFIKNELGMALYHMDTDTINGGYPVLSWQGGSAVDVSADEKALMEDLQAVQICDLELAKTAQKMRDAADAEIDEMFAESNLSMINEFIQDNLGYADGKIRTWEEARIIFQAAFYEAYEKEYLETTGKEIDLFNFDGHLTPDNDGVYHITESTRLSFTAEGENGSKITWSSNSAALDAGNGLVTPPKTGTATVKLTATASMNGASKSRSMTVLIYSAQSDAAKTLSEIAQKLSTWGTYVQPVQIRGHENAADALKFWLYENGYENGYDDEGITVTFKAPGKITYGMSEGKSYLAEDGKVTYYQGENSDCKYVVYDGATFELSVNGATQEVTAQVRIGWDIEKAIDLMQSALDTELTWEKIKGENENNASPSDFKNEDGSIKDTYTGVVVNGEVTKKLVVPQTVTVDGVAIQVGFAVLPSSAVTYQFTENNTIEITPRRVPKGTKDKTFDLQLVTLFDANLDDYTIDAMKNQSDDTTSALQVHNALRITCAEETEDTQSVISKNLEELLPGLITNYYDYGAAVDLSKPVKDDLLIPRLYKMEDAGIFEDYSSKMQDVESLTPNVAEVNGYHITVYRPLPGEEPATAQIRIAIHKRDKDENDRSQLGDKLGEMILEFKVEPLTQAEIDAAKALMNEVTTESFYWNAIKGENTDQNHITSSLNPFYKVVKNESGSFSYLKSGETDWHVEGIYTDDHPGYDPMQVYGATYRTYYSSRHDVLSYEQLLLTQPEYNTKVEISSWLTYTQYAKYYEKFVVDAQTPNTDYNQFETFYKHKVSTTVTVNGTSGKDETEKPNPEGKDVTAYVTLDAKGAKGDGTDKVFASTSSVYADDDGKYEITIRDNGNGVTVANVMEAFFKETDYTSEAYISEYGAYIYSITDPNGVTLAGGTDERPYSGWMYKISGNEHPDSINLVFVQEGDVITFYYTENYLKDLDKNSPEYEPYKVLIEDVENKVKAIPDEITLDNAAEFEKAYTLAQNAYNDLDEGIRENLLDAWVSETLDAKQAMLEAFKETHSAADVVTAMIAKLPEPSQVTAGDRAAVERAYNAYIALTAAEMKNISEEDRQKLMDCRQALEGLDETADIMQSLRDTLAEIQNEKDVRASEERFVAAAADIYNNQLTKQQQKQAKKEYTLLKAAQKSLAANIKAADKVKDLITKKLTGETEALTLKDRSTVNSVEKSYEKLSDGAKTFLTGTSEKDTYDAFIAQRDYLNENEREIKANEAAAEAVEKQIKKLPKTVKLTDSDKIDAARAAYDALTAVQKALVTNYATLTAAEEKYAALVEANKTELQKADEARELIAMLPVTVVYNHDSKEHEAQIKQARAAYDALGKVGKDYVGKEWLKVLKNAEKALKKAVSQDTKDQKAAGKLAQKIAKLPEAELVISKNEKAIKAARTAYDKLTDNAKLYADELTYKLDDTDKLYMTKLSECEEELKKVLDEEAEAEDVEALIKKLPTAKKVTEEDREDVWDALQAYNALSEKQQTLMVASKYVKKLMECCKALEISTEGDGGDIDLTALELAQAEAVEQAAIIEQFVLADDKDDETIEEAFDDTLDDELDAIGD